MAAKIINFNLSESWQWAKELWRTKSYVSGFLVQPIIGFHLPRAFSHYKQWWIFCVWGGLKNSAVYDGIDLSVGIRLLGLMLAVEFSFEQTHHVNL